MDKLNKLTDFHKRCIHNCISHVLACNYRSTHPDLTDDEVIARCRKNAGYTDNIEFTLADYCKAQKLDIKEVREFIDDVYGTVQFSDPE